MPASPTTFRRLLKAESTAAMPTTEREVDALFDTYHVRPDHDARKVRGTNSKPSSERLELAAAVLWFHTHVNDPVPALTRLPFEIFLVFFLVCLRGRGLGGWAVGPGRLVAALSPQRHGGRAGAS